MSPDLIWKAKIMHNTNRTMNYVMILTNLLLTVILFVNMQTPNLVVLKEVKDQGADIQAKMMALIKDVSDIRSITEMNQKWIAEADKLHGSVLQNICNEVQYQEWQKNVERFNCPPNK